MAAPHLINVLLAHTAWEDSGKRSKSFVNWPGETARVLAYSTGALQVYQVVPAGTHTYAATAQNYFPPDLQQRGIAAVGWVGGGQRPVHTHHGSHEDCSRTQERKNDVMVGIECRSTEGRMQQRARDHAPHA